VCAGLLSCSPSTYRCFGTSSSAPVGLRATRKLAASTLRSGELGSGTLKKVGSNLGPTSDKLGPKQCIMTQYEARQTNQIAFFRLPWAQTTFDTHFDTVTIRWHFPEADFWTASRDLVLRHARQTDINMRPYLPLAASLGEANVRFFTRRGQVEVGDFVVVSTCCLSRAQHALSNPFLIIPDQ